jgi:hypothetical protein
MSWDMNPLLAAINRLLGACRGARGAADRPRVAQDFAVQPVAPGTARCASRVARFSDALGRGVRTFAAAVSCVGLRRRYHSAAPVGAATASAGEHGATPGIAPAGHEDTERAPNPSEPRAGSDGSEGSEGSEIPSAAPLAGEPAMKDEIGFELRASVEPASQAVLHPSAPLLPQTEDKAAASELSREIAAAAPLSAQSFDALVKGACEQLRRACDTADTAAIEAFGERLGRSTDLTAEQMTCLLQAKSSLGRPVLHVALGRNNDRVITAVGKLINENPALQAGHDSQQWLMELWGMDYGTDNLAPKYPLAVAWHDGVVVAFGEGLKASHLPVSLQYKIVASSMPRLPQHIPLPALKALHTELMLASHKAQQDFIDPHRA